MSEEPIQNNNSKPIKVINWESVESGQAAGGGPATPPPGKNRGGLKYVVGALAVLLVLFLSIRVWNVVQDLRAEGAEQREQLQAELEEANSVGRPKASLSRADVMRKLSDSRRLLDGNPAMMEQILKAEKEFQKGEDYFLKENYPAAYTQFSSVEQRLDQFSEEVEYKNKAYVARDRYSELFEEYDEHRELGLADFESAFSLSSQGQVLLEEGNFKQSEQRYAQASNLLEGLGEKLSAQVEAYMAEGSQALAEGRGQVAADLFKRVLSIEPDNEPALSFLERSKTIAQLHPLLLEAKALEDANQLQEANEKYTEAFELDALSAKAQQGKSRTAKKLKESKFKKALLAAKSALAIEDWDVAIAAYRSALSVYPENEVVQKALADTELLAFQSEVNEALALAYSFEQSRDWKESRDAFSRVLKIDPENSEAKQGLLRTGKVIRALLRYEKFMLAAQASSDAGEYQKAIGYLNEAIQAKPDYIALTASESALKHFLKLQDKAITLEVTSDGRTWVNIAGFELLGKFKKKSITIKPGNYRFVGRRKGYHDASVEVQIRGGEPNPLVHIACTNKASR